MEMFDNCKASVTETHLDHVILSPALSALVYSFSKSPLILVKVLLLLLGHCEATAKTRLQHFPINNTAVVYS